MKLLFLLLSFTISFLHTSSAVVQIYLENISGSSDGYNFYTDATKTTELNLFEGTDTLNVNETYEFFRLTTATGHAFYISDDAANSSNLTNGSGPTSDITLVGDGTYQAGITANQKITLSFNSGFDYTSDTLYYYCTSHPTSMVAAFTVVPEPSTYALIAGALVLGYAMYRRRK